MQVFMPVLQLLLVAASSALCGFLFFTLKRDLYWSDQRGRAEREAAAARVAAIETELAALRNEIESSSPPAAPLPTGSGININKRSQALRMLKLGQGPEHVAAALNVARKEVELLVKIQKMLVETSAPTS